MDTDTIEQNVSEILAAAPDAEMPTEQQRAVSTPLLSGIIIVVFLVNGLITRFFHLLQSEKLADAKSEWEEIQEKIQQVRASVDQQASELQQLKEERSELNERLAGIDLALNAHFTTPHAPMPKATKKKAKKTK